MQDHPNHPFTDDAQPQQTRTEAATDKKCPACGGTMDFDPKTGGLACPYCGHTQAIQQEAEQHASAVEMDFFSAQDVANRDWGAEKKTVICQSCGAQSIYDARQLASECPYCGSNQVIVKEGTDSMAPGGVCPFVVTAKQAGENFKAWIKGKLFCPGVAKRSAKPESFKGVYLPYWTFDAQTHSRYTARYGINRTVYDKDGKPTVVTDWYSTAGNYAELMDDVLVEATTRYDPTILDRIRPFDTHANKAYRPEYVAGFAAERYSIGLGDGWQQAQADIMAHLQQAVSEKVRSECRADIVSDVQLDTQYSGITYKYLLLPLWISAFHFKNKIFQFMVNGQTGRVGGKSPVSPLRVAIACLIGAAILVGIYFLYTTTR